MGKDELIVIVPAAGAGKRLGLGINKAFAMLNGAPLLVHCLHMLEATGLVKRAVVVLAPQEIVEGRELLAGYQKDYFRTLPFCVVAGGKERQDSVANALAAVEETDCYIAVHDGARPFAGRAVFERTLAAAKVHGAAIAAVPVKDTIKVVGTDADGSTDTADFYRRTAEAGLRAAGGTSRCCYRRCFGSRADGP